MDSKTPATDAAFTDPTVTEGQQRGLCAEFEIENAKLREELATLKRAWAATCENE